MYSCYLGANIWSLPRQFSPLQCLFLKPLYRSRTARSSKVFLPSVYSNARWISARLWPSQDKNFTTERYWFLKLKDIFASANPASFHSQISRRLEYCLPSEISSASDVQRTRYSMSEYAGLIGNSLIYIVAYVSCSIFFSWPVFSKKVVFIMNLYKRSPNLGTKKATYLAHFGMAYCDRGSQVYTRIFVDRQIVFSLIDWLVRPTERSNLSSRHPVLTCGLHGVAVELHKANGINHILSCYAGSPWPLRTTPTQWLRVARSLPVLQ